MILEPVEILVAFATEVTAVWLFLLHTDSAGVRDRSRGIDNRKRAVRILLELLVLMSMLFVVLEAVLILVCLFAADDGAFKWLDLLADKTADTGQSGEELLLAHALRELAVGGDGLVREAFAVTLSAQQALCRVINSARPTVIVQIETVEVKVAGQPEAVVNIQVVQLSIVVNTGGFGGCTWH